MQSHPNDRCRRFLLALLLIGAPVVAAGRGVSPYLPLDMAPEMARLIEHVMIIADRPITARPIPLAAVLDALPAACRVDLEACTAVRRYLDRYMRKAGLITATAELAATDGAAAPLPNRHGMLSDSTWRASAQGYWQPNDYVLLNLGGIAHDGGAVATGSMLSFGFEYAQVDVGYRDHWLSPFTGGAMLISTQARTLPSITVSNYRPISRLGLQYQVFLAEMGYSDRIAFEGGYTAGHPRLAGLRLAIEPVPGWSLAANRFMQYGGGERDNESVSGFFDALFRPRQADNSLDPTHQNEFGNQQASFTSRFIFPGPIPFAAYLEYAGEDTSFSGNWRLGNAALQVGVNFPQLWRRFDLTYEFSEFQNGWYVHHIYQDGMTQDGHVLGLWAADHRVLHDDVGAQAHMLRIGWEPSFGGLLQIEGRTVENQNYGAHHYERGYDLALAYSRPVGTLTAGAQILGGRDVFGENYGRLSGFVRFGDVWGRASSGPGEGIERPAGADLFVDAGINYSRIDLIVGDGSPTQHIPATAQPHVAIGARRAVSRHNDFGVRAELDRIDGHLLLAVRALDYRHRFDGPLAFTFFIGAARYDVATPAYGYYFGAGLQWRDILPRFDLGLDLRYMDKVARDKLLPTDPASTPRPDMFYDISSSSLSLSYRF